LFRRHQFSPKSKCALSFPAFHIFNPTPSFPLPLLRGPSSIFFHYFRHLQLRLLDFLGKFHPSPLSFAKFSFIFSRSLKVKLVECFVCDLEQCGRVLLPYLAYPFFALAPSTFQFLLVLNPPHRVLAFNFLSRLLTLRSIARDTLSTLLEPHLDAGFRSTSR